MTKTKTRTRKPRLKHVRIERGTEGTEDAFFILRKDNGRLLAATYFWDDAGGKPARRAYRRAEAFAVALDKFHDGGGGFYPAIEDFGPWEGFEAQLSLAWMHFDAEGGDPATRFGSAESAGVADDSEAMSGHMKGDR